MSGIIDKKERILDFIITENGRSQIQDNDIRIKYASLSDRSINYSKDDLISQQNKADISDAEFYYMPLEDSPKIFSNLNPDFSLKKFFTYSYGPDQNGNILNLNSLTDEQKQNLVTFNDYDKELEKFYENFSFLSSIKKLKLISTRALINQDVEFSIENTGNSEETYYFNKTEKYGTINKYNERLSNIPVISLDKRFSHKTNNKILIPKDISGNDLYEISNFKKINAITNKFNTAGFLFKNYNVYNEVIDKVSSREKEIAQVIKKLEVDYNILRKEHNIVNGGERLSLLFEMNEIGYKNVNSTEPEDVSEKKIAVEKLHFVKIGDFYIDNSLKKVYLIGKIVNSRDDTKDLDVSFSFNNGTVDLKSKSSFVLSAYYSFVTMFTLVIE